MKSAIIYYSYTGNTRKVAVVLHEYLMDKGPVETIELVALDESKSFFGQGQRAFKHVRAKIATVNSDLSAYDLICFGTPVWAFGPAPAMNAYLDRCSGLEGKSVILFTTYGSGAGNKRCLDNMQGLLSKKGVRDFRRFCVQQLKVNDLDAVLEKVRETFSVGG